MVTSVPYPFLLQMAKVELRDCFAKGLEAAFLALLEPFQWAALASLRSMMRLMAQWIIATPVSGSRS